MSLVRFKAKNHPQQVGRRGATDRNERMTAYFDFHDWWIGYYRGDTHHYVCLLPCLVLRWSR